ncbi:hypothetical protein BKQ19_01965 [Lacticaseibacillus paracasei]|nr:hypothetical protein BKQ19_01965 [Lacticaseibacillus paracasei]
MNICLISCIHIHRDSRNLSAFSKRIMGDEEILNHAVDLITKQGANICEPAKRDKQDWCREWNGIRQNSGA